MGDEKVPPNTTRPAHLLGPVYSAHVCLRVCNEQWPKEIGTICDGGTVSDSRWNIIDVRDLVAAHR